MELSLPQPDGLGDLGDRQPGVGETDHLAGQGIGLRGAQPLGGDVLEHDGRVLWWRRSSVASTSALPHTSASATRWSRSASAGTPNTAGPVPGAKRTAANGVPARACARWGVVSGPAITSVVPSQIRSMQPSGRIHESVPSATRRHTVAPATRDGRSR